MSKKGSDSGEGRRPTKAERQEEARRQRLEIERQMSARKRNRTIGLALVIAATVAVVAVVVLANPTKKNVTANGIPTMAELLGKSDAAVKTAGCDAVVETSNYDNAQGADPDIDHHHIGDASVATPPPLSTYATQPPTSGPHDGTPLAAGIYDSAPDVYQSLHSLEHGGVVIWYAPTAADTPEVAQIRDFYSQSANVGQSKVIVAPYSFPNQGVAGQLPKGVQMAVVAWHRLQTCTTPSLAVAFKFAAQYESLPAPIAGQTYIGVAREPTSGM